MPTRTASATAQRLGASFRDPSEKVRSAAIKEVAGLVHRCGGVLTRVSASLGISHRSLTRWIKDHEELNALVREVREAKGLPHYFGDPARSKAKTRARAKK